MRYRRGISAPVASRGPTQKPEPHKRCRETRSLGGTRMEGRRRLSYRVDRSIEQLQASTSGCGVVYLSVVDSQKGREKTASGTDCFHAFPVHAFDVATLDVQPGVDNVLHGLSVPHLSFLGLKSERIRTSATPICKDELSGSHRRQWIMRVDHCPWTQSPVKSF